jgi:hypothetical protein
MSTTERELTPGVQLHQLMNYPHMLNGLLGGKAFGKF